MMLVARVKKGVPETNIIVLYPGISQYHRHNSADDEHNSYCPAVFQKSMNRGYQCFMNDVDRFPDHDQLFR